MFTPLQPFVRRLSLGISILAIVGFTFLSPAPVQAQSEEIIETVLNSLGLLPTPVDCRNNNPIGLEFVFEQIVMNIEPLGNLVKELFCPAGMAPMGGAFVGLNPALLGLLQTINVNPTSILFTLQNVGDVTLADILINLQIVCTLIP